MFLLTDRTGLHLLAMVTFLHMISQARSVVNQSSTDDVLWQPAEGTREEWMDCRGMPKDVCERTKIKKQELQKMLAKKLGLDRMANDSSSNDSGVDQCIMFTEEQLDTMIAEAKNDGKTTSTHRKKRTLIDFKKDPFSKWSMPVHYMFDGTHDSKQRATIRAAFQHWSDNTCIRFRELPTKYRYNSSYILIAKNESDGCWSFLGQINRAFQPQSMNLASNCVNVFGIVLHEIGHSLGLRHEQSRIDRNDSIRIIWNNIRMVSWSQYFERNTDAFGLPYNYGSVMHYPSKSGFSVVYEVDTLIALDPLYQMNMGQRSDLSFNDKKIINLAYCTGTCKIPLSQPCQRGGYQNPNNCSICSCPDGFSGKYCNEIAQSKNANCSGILSIAPGIEKVIKSPGFDGKGYAVNQECTWWIKASQGHTLRLAFNGSFSIYCQGSTCAYHWVEIKYKEDLGLEGARFCCNNRPNYTLVSESNEMMVIFRSNYNVNPRWQALQRGFQAIVESIPPSSSSTVTALTSGNLLLRTLLQLSQLTLLKLPLALLRA